MFAGHSAWADVDDFPDCEDGTKTTIKAVITGLEDGHYIEMWDGPTDGTCYVNYIALDRKLPANCKRGSLVTASGVLEDADVAQILRAVTELSCE
jgi:hypothetical protein